MGENMVQMLVRFLLEKKILLNAKKIEMLKSKSEAERNTFFETIKDESSEEIKKKIDNFCQEKKEEKEEKKEKNRGEDTAEGTVTLLTNFESKDVNKKIGDFISYFNARYKAIEKL